MESFRALAFLWKPILFIIVIRWLYVNEFEPLAQLDDGLVIPILIGLILLVVGFPFFLLAAVDIAISFAAIVFGIKEILIITVLPLLAIYAFFSVAARATARGVQGLFFYITEPPASKEIRRTIKNQKTHPDAGAHIQTVLNSEMRKAIIKQRKWWIPAFMVSLSIAHNKRIAKLIHSIADVSDAAEKHVTEEEKKKYD